MTAVDPTTTAVPSTLPPNAYSGSGQTLAPKKALEPHHIRFDLGILTDEELAAALGVTTQTLATWRGDKYGPTPTKLGKSVYYRTATVREWIKAAEQIPNKAN